MAMSQNYTKYLFILLVGLVVSWVLTPLVIRVARLIGMVDKPDERRIHTGIIPRGGGLAVFAGFHVACAAIYFLPWYAFDITLSCAWWLKFLPASLFLMLVGVADDRWGLKPRVKLGCQIIAALALYASGVHLGRLFYYPLPGLVDCVLTVFWCVGFMNAFNLIDGLDGLAAGLGTIAAAGVAGSMVIRHMPGDTLVMLGLMGACVGFLRYNFNPARVFLGDTGSMFIGFTLAAVSLSTGSKGTIVTSMAIPLLAAGVPILDTMLAIWRRSVRHLRQNMAGDNNSQGEVFSADKDHLHHRLLRTGNSHRKVAFTLYIINGCLVGVGLLSLVFHSFATAIYLSAFVAAIYVIVRHLAYVELWDSGMAVLQGLRRPPPKAIAVMVYPVADCVVLAASLLLSIYLTHPLMRQSLRVLWLDQSFVWITLPFICLVVSGTYSRVWSRARPTEYIVMMLAVAGGVVLATAFDVLVTHHLLRVQVGKSGLFAGLAIVTLIGMRIFPRVIQDGLPLLLRNGNIIGVPQVPIIVYGAGYSFMLFMQAKAHKAFSQKQHRIVMGVLDDDSNLHGRTVYGCRVMGGIEKLEAAITRSGAKEIVITTYLNEPILRTLESCAERHKIPIFRWRTDIRSQQLAGVHFSFDRCLQETTNRILSARSVSLEDDMSHILRLSANFAEADSCYAVFFAFGTEIIEKKYRWAADDSPLRKNMIDNIQALRLSFLTRQLREQKIVRIHDVAGLPPEAHAEKSFLQTRGVQSAIVVPIGREGHLLGFMGYYGVHSNVIWEERAVSLLKLQADILALMLPRLPIHLGGGSHDV